MPVALQPEEKLLLAGESFGYVTACIVRSYAIECERQQRYQHSILVPAQRTQFSTSPFSRRKGARRTARSPRSTGFLGGGLPDSTRMGSIDSGFQGRAGGQINTLALQADGRILIGGDFLTVDGYLTPSIARLEGGSVPPGPNTAPW
jgi:hypothetical protein